MGLKDVFADPFLPRSASFPPLQAMIDGSGHDHQQALPRQHTPKLDRGWGVLPSEYAADEGDVEASADGNLPTRVGARAHLDRTGNSLGHIGNIPQDS
jgi:hypothetical protein